MKPEPSIARRLMLARMALLWERLWVAVWLPVSIVGVFLAVALLDVLPHLPGAVHAGVLAGLGLAVVVTLWRGLRGLRLPGAAEVRHRLEAAALHRPLTAQQDALAQGSDDSLARLLWDAHARRVAAAAESLRAGLPRPGVAARDAWGFRAVPVLALFVAVVAAWPDPWPRLVRAVTPTLAGMTTAGAGLGVDLWVMPPDYTGQPPITRTGLAGDGSALDMIEVPEGSQLLMIVHGADAPLVRLGVAYAEPQALADDSHRLEATLDATEGNAVLAVVERGRAVARWPLRVVPDRAPTVTFSAPPSAGPRARLRVPFEASDDYGLVDLSLRLTRVGAAGQPVESVELPLPPGQPAEAAGQPLVDLTPHPWAGLAVAARLSVRDARGQRGQSEPLTIVLPERAFTHPVAQELAAQRKTLVREPDQRFAVAAMLDAIAARPATYDGDQVVFMGLRVASSRLRFAAPGVAPPAVVDLLWQMAVRLEDGALATAEERLAEAERALDEALREDAPAEEINALVEELQRALAEYMQALMDTMPAMDMTDMPQIAMPQDMMDMGDMARMLDDLSRMSEIGARDAARQMMESLREMLQSLRNAEPMPSEAAQQMRETMEALRALADRQEELLNQTFNHSREDAAADRDLGRRAPRPDEMGPGDRQSDDRAAPSDPLEGARLAEEQERLRRALGDVMADLAEMMGGVPQNLGAAELDMRQASDALAGQSWMPAEEAQGRALDALREGAGEAMQQMMQAMGQQGQGMMMMMPFGQRPGPGTDPLGRGMGGVQTDGTQIPTEPDTRRARDILMELRRRANDLDRPSPERDYLRRLLRQF